MMRHTRPCPHTSMMYIAMYLQVESIFEDVRKQIEDRTTNSDAAFDPSAVPEYTSDLQKYLDEATEEGTHKLRVYLQERYKEALENVISGYQQLCGKDGNAPDQ